MTEEKKEILIAKMLDAPSSLSDEELDLILHDDELHDIYEASAALSSACVIQPEWDMKAEWSNFRPRIQRKPNVMRWVMRVAAIFLGVVLVSGIAVRIIDSVFTGDQSSIIANVEKVNDVPDTTVEHNNVQETEIKESPMQGSVTVAAGPTASGRHLAKANIRKSQNDATQVESDIDVDEYLRIQQARIDNDLAMQIAESYIEEYDDIVAILDAAGAYNPELDNVIRKVTME